MILPRLTAVAGLVMAGLTCGSADAATWCVGNSSQLYQALLGSSLNNEADVIRLQTGTYTSGLPEGFTASITGGGLELSGGWSSSCLFPGRAAPAAPSTASISGRPCASVAPRTRIVPSASPSFPLSAASAMSSAACQCRAVATPP